MTDSRMPELHLPSSAEDIPDMPAEIAGRIDDAVAIIQLVKGEASERPFWAYVAMKPSLYKEYFTKVMAGQGIDLKTYGDVIESGWGDEPPQEIHDRMVAEYGFDDDLEQSLQAMARQGHESNRGENT